MKFEYYFDDEHIRDSVRWNEMQRDARMKTRRVVLSASEWDEYMRDTGRTGNCWDKIQLMIDGRSVEVTHE